MREDSIRENAVATDTASKAKKALIVTTVSGFVPQFEMNNVRILQGMGYEVHYASNFRNPSYGSDNSRLNGTGIVRHQVDFARSPFQVKENGRAYHQLKQLLKEQQFELLHCHTPVGAALSRIAARIYQRRGRKKARRLKVIYTAHGFHFYKGAPFKYWLLFYPVERWLARFTDVLITINEEDYERANKFCRHKKTKVKHIAGIGIDTSYFSGKELPEGEREAIRDAVRKRLYVKEGELLFLSVGELIPRKNHAAAIQAFAEIEKESSRNSPFHFRYAICGQGVLKEDLQRQIDMAGLSEKVYLPGYQKDVRGLLYAADVFIFPSHQEGMPVALMEAIAADVPVIASDIRGNRELLRRQENALSFTDAEGLRYALKYVLEHGTELRAHERRTNSKMGDFDIEQVGKQMQTIYKELEI